MAQATGAAGLLQQGAVGQGLDQMQALNQWMTQNGMQAGPQAGAMPPQQEDPFMTLMNQPLRSGMMDMF